MLKIDEPLFTTNELAYVAGIDIGLAKTWVQRGLLEPDRADRVAIRHKPLFSVMTVFRAKMAREFGELGVVASAAAKSNAAKEGISPEALKAIAAASADQDRRQSWMWGMARSIERGRPLSLIAGVTQQKACWTYFIALDLESLGEKMGSDTIYLVVPIGKLFSEVYLGCRELCKPGGAN